MAHVMASLVMLLIFTMFGAFAVYPFESAMVMLSLLLGAWVVVMIYMLYHVYMSIVEAFR